MERINSKKEMIEKLKHMKTIEELTRERYIHDTADFQDDQIKKTIDIIKKEEDVHIELLTQLINMLEE